MQVAGVEEITRRRSSQGCVSLARQEVGLQLFFTVHNSLKLTPPGEPDWGDEPDCKHRVQFCWSRVLPWRDWPGRYFKHSHQSISNILLKFIFQDSSQNFYLVIPVFPCCEISLSLTWVRSKSVYSRCWPSTRSTGRSSTWTDSHQARHTSPPTIIRCHFDTDDYLDQEKTRSPIRVTKASHNNHMPLWPGIVWSRAPTLCFLPR